MHLISPNPLSTFNKFSYFKQHFEQSLPKFPRKQSIRTITVKVEDNEENKEKQTFEMFSNIIRNFHDNVLLNYYKYHCYGNYIKNFVFGETWVNIPCIINRINFIAR